MVEKKKKLSVLETNVLYLVIALLLITLGAKAQSREVYTGLLITEYLIILLPVLLCLKLKGFSVKDTIRLNKISFKQIILTIFIVIFSYPVAVFFNFIGIMILSKFTELVPNPIPIPSTLEEYLIGFLVMALTPGICEEVMFRGMVMSSYEPFGERKAIIYSAILFGLFHFNLQNLLGPIILGLIFGIIAFKTNSLFPTIIGHTVNNTIALTIGYFFTNNGEKIKEMSTIGIEDMVVSLISLGVLALIFGFLVYILIKKLPTGEDNQIIGNDNFIKVDPLIKDINLKKGLKFGEFIPILLVIIIFIYYHCKYFFI